MKNLAKQFRYYVWAYWLIVAFFMLGHNFLHAQENADNQDEEEFINFGYISVSSKYTIDSKAKNVTFKIRNNSTRSIKNIFFWIYEFKKDAKGAVEPLRLVNNPNKSGLPIKEATHEPYAEEKWRFHLIAANPPVDDSKKFALLVDPRGIKFAKFEKYFKKPK